MRQLKARGLDGVERFISDKCLGLVEQRAEFYPAAMLKAIHAQEDRAAAA